MYSGTAIEVLPNVLYGNMAVGCISSSVLATSCMLFAGLRAQYALLPLTHFYEKGLLGGG